MESEWAVLSPLVGLSCGERTDFGTWNTIMMMMMMDDNDDDG
jgi:hypothetical protein